MVPEKQLTRVSGTHTESGLEVSGYEIHIGRTNGPDCARPFVQLAGHINDGATSRDGRVIGSYLHGLFHEDAFRKAFLERLGKVDSSGSYAQGVELALERLADHVEEHLDVEGLISVAR